MKKLTLGFCALVALSVSAFAGETYSKESKAVVPPPCPQWYADHEFNLSLSGVYAFSGSDSDLIDHAWGGAIDAKYFFARHFGIGVQGFLLDSNSDDDDNRNGRFRNDDDDDGVGGILGPVDRRCTLTLERLHEESISLARSKKNAGNTYSVPGV